MIEQGQYALTLGHDDLCLCASTTTDGFCTVSSIRFPSHGLGRPVVWFSRICISEKFTLVGFEPGSHGQNIAVLTTRPRTHTHDTYEVFHSICCNDVVTDRFLPPNFVVCKSNIASFKICILLDKKLTLDKSIKFISGKITTCHWNWKNIWFSYLFIFIIYGTTKKKMTHVKFSELFFRSFLLLPFWEHC